MNDAKSPVLDNDGMKNKVIIQRNTNKRGAHGSKEPLINLPASGARFLLVKVVT